jgi:hypothetical protein
MERKAISMKIILLGLNHEVQWKDPSGHLRQILADEINNSSVDLVAEEAAGLPTTVAQRLAYKFDKPWIDIDMSRADRKLAGIDDALIARQTDPIDPFKNIGSRCLYLFQEDGIREEEWLLRMLKRRADVVLCLCGFMHVDPFTKKLEETGCSVKQLKLTELPWFQDLYCKYSIVEENGKRWCEMRRQ